MRYNFLILCGLFALPALAIAIARKDLRWPMLVMAFLSLPFALTERWFYPEYWRPRFLFDLADRVGFGIEDFLFVAALASFTCGVYPFAARRCFIDTERSEPPSRRALRSALVFLSMLGLVVGLRLLSVPTIFGACFAMVGVALGMLSVRRDLFKASFLGAMLALVVYCALCTVFAKILPGVFRLAWNTDKLTNLFVLGVPLEELLYGFSAGFAGTCAYPFLTARHLGPLP
jgi:hypothetical protein